MAGIVKQRDGTFIYLFKDARKYATTDASFNAFRISHSTFKSLIKDYCFTYVAPKGFTVWQS
jgi:hypothetical protein